MLEIEPTAQNGRTTTGSDRDGRGAYRFAAIRAISC